MSDPHAQIRRVALTGGPAAGKTAILDVLRRHLIGQVVVLPETATTLFRGGFPRPTDPAGIRLLQKTIYEVQHNLEEIFALENINDLPIEFDIGWYEQKAVAVLLALLHLGVKGIRLGPTLPAFLSPNVAKILVETFDIMPTGEVADDVKAMTA